MPKTIYTERDIEDMAKGGILTLEVNDQVALTDLAYEKARKLGLKLVSGRPENPPAAPIRPYLSQASVKLGPAPGPETGAPPPEADGAALHKRIREAVIARLGTQVDANLLDTIITRVLHSTGAK